MTGAMEARRPRGRPVPVGDVLAAYLDRTGLGESLARLGAIDEWSGAVGPKVSRVTRPVEVQGDTLVVEVISSAWLAELSMMRSYILDRVNAVRGVPTIGRIRFRLAQNPQNVGNPESERRAAARGSRVERGARGKRGGRG